MAKVKSVKPEAPAKSEKQEIAPPIATTEICNAQIMCDAVIVEGGMVAVVKDTEWAMLTVKSGPVQFRIAYSRARFAQWATPGRRIRFQGRILRNEAGSLNVLAARISFLDRPSDEQVENPFEG